MQLQVRVGVHWFEKYQGILQSRCNHVVANNANGTFAAELPNRGMSFRNVVSQVPVIIDCLF